ncbi:MAG: acyl-CoA dehydrogenase [Eubacterium sp.]|nr:acyl-CoA dehydrogenase [Candidatus Colimonas fimequi]
MNFELNKQQEFVVKTIRKFAENEVKPIAAEIDENHRFPHETVEKMGKMGLMGLPVPREYGGAGGDLLSYYLAIEELGKVCATTAVICSAHISLVTWPIFHFGTEQQRRKYIPDMAAGRKLGAFALTEPNAGTDSAKQETKAVLDGDEYVLNGIKTLITNGGPADVFLVFAMTDKSKKNKGISAFIVEREDEGFFIGENQRKMGICASSTVNLTFKNCRIPKDRLVGKEGQGFKIAMQTLDGGRIGIAAQALGIAEGAFEEALTYLKTRKQFGGPLTRMQALTFEMAELKTEIEASRGLIYHAIDLKQRGLPYSEFASMCKLHTAETAMRVTTRCVQFMAGYGFSKDYPVERMMRDAKVTEIYEGTSEVQKLVISSKFI